MQWRVVRDQASQRSHFLSQIRSEESRQVTGAPLNLLVVGSIPTRPTNPLLSAAAKRRLLTIQAIRCLSVVAHSAIYVVEHLLVCDIVFAFNFAAILERRVTSRQENEGLCVQ